MIIAIQISASRAYLNLLCSMDLSTMHQGCTPPAGRGRGLRSWGWENVCFNNSWDYVGIYRVSSSDITPKDTAHKQITDQYTSILDVVKTLKEGNSPRPETTRPLQAIY